MTSEREQIQAFLQTRPLTVPTAPAIRKAGLVAFIPSSDEIHYCVILPVGMKPDLGLPEYQLCKGTRMYQLGKEWRDMRGPVPEDALLETLPETALREGIEELGLKLSNIASLHPLGDYHFTSATNRKEVVLWLLAVAIKHPEDFLPLADIAATTADRRWMTLAEFRRAGRPDHAHILGVVEEKISILYK